MRLNLYSVKDIKVGAYMNPFISMGDVQAMRMFHEIACDPKTQIFKYPADFELYMIGGYDDGSGELYTELKFLCSAVTVTKSVFPDNDAGK